MLSSNPTIVSSKLKLINLHSNFAMPREHECNESAWSNTLTTRQNVMMCKNVTQ